MKHSSKTELIIYAIICLFSMPVINSSCKLGLGGREEIGPGFVPFVSSLSILLFGALLILGTLLRRGHGGYSLESERATWKNWVRVAVILSSLAIWPLMVKYIGYILSNFLVSYGTAKAVGYKGLRPPIILAACISLIIWIIFGFAFDVDLPSGFSEHILTFF